MNKKQIEIMNADRFKIDGNKIMWKKDSIASIVFEQSTKLFILKIN